jgi:hypothetical protein
VSGGRGILSGVVKQVVVNALSRLSSVRNHVLEVAKQMQALVSDVRLPRCWVRYCYVNWRVFVLCVV